MLYSNNFMSVKNTFYILSMSFKRVKIKPTFVQSRSFINNKESNNPEDINRSRERTSAPYRGYDDPTFTKHFFEHFKDPRSIKFGFFGLLRECKKFCEEKRTKIKKFADHNIASKINRVDMLFIFDKEEDLTKFVVNTDSSFFLGYSSASLKITQSRTALFSGNICTDLPKDGNVQIAGYANMISKRQIISFHRIKCYDWSEYTHLVLKIRGDGRNYLIILTAPDKFVDACNWAYAHPLYTRGGPYWQIAKIPFSHFYLLNKTIIYPDQSSPIRLRHIQKLGITAAGFDGPFKLEIDYIGLEYDPFHNTTSPYEKYRKSSFI